MMASPFRHQEANGNKGVLGSPHQVLTTTTTTKATLITHRVLSKEWVFARIRMLSPLYFRTSVPVLPSSYTGFPTAAVDHRGGNSREDPGAALGEPQPWCGAWSAPERAGSRTGPGRSSRERRAKAKSASRGSISRAGNPRLPLPEAAGCCEIGRP